MYLCRHILHERDNFHYSSHKDETEAMPNKNARHQHILVYTDIGQNS